MSDAPSIFYGGLRGRTGATVPLTFIASRYDPTLRAFRQRLEAAGKPVKVAITACARKLLTILNAMARNGKDCLKE